MFDREELLILANEVKNTKLLYKINSLLYIDDILINELKKYFLSDGLLYVEKVDCVNEYYIHFLVDTDSSSLKLIQNVKLFEKKYYKNKALKGAFYIVIHESISDFWMHDGISAYIRDDLKEYLNKKNS